MLKKKTAHQEEDEKNLYTHTPQVIHSNTSIQLEEREKKKIAHLQMKKKKQKKKQDKINKKEPSEALDTQKEQKTNILFFFCLLFSGLQSGKKSYHKVEVTKRGQFKKKKKKHKV